MPNMFETLIGAPPNTEEALRRTAAQLRAQQDFGMIAALSRDPNLTKFGGQMMGQVSERTKGLQQSRQKGIAEQRLQDFEKGRRGDTQTYRDQMQANYEEQFGYTKERDITEDALKLAIAELRAQNKVNSRAKDIDKYRLKYSQELGDANLPDIEENIGKVDAELAQYLDPKTGKLIGDLPGTGPMGRFSVGEKARKLKQLRAQAENILLAARSGKAVTEAEFKRFAKEFAGTAFSTDQNFMDAWNNFKESVAAKRKNIERGIPPEARKAYDQNLSSYDVVNEYSGDDSYRDNYRQGDDDSYF